MNISRQGRLSLDDLKYVQDVSDRRVVYGDVLFNNTNSQELVGKTAFLPLDEPAAFSNHMTRLRTDPSVLEPKFLALQLHTLWEGGHFKSICSNHVNQASVSAKKLAEVEIVVPPLNEQRRIVEILEDHLSRLEAARRAVSHSRIRLIRLRQAMLSHALSSAQLPECEVRSIGEIAAVSTGATPLKSRRDYYTGGTIPWVTSAELTQGLIGQPAQFITARALSETSVKLFPPGTLLVAMYGEGKTRGTVGELAVAATTNQACAAVQLHDPDPSQRQWVRLVLEANYWNLRRLASGGVQPNLNLGLVRQIRLPLPDMDLRRSLLHTHDAQEQARHRLESGLRLVERRESRLKAALLSAAFSGRLTGRSSEMDLVEEMAVV